MTSAASGGILGLVPARGGSKRLPGKNVTDVAGKPLIAWTLEAAAAAQRLDRVVVSTDDQEIARVARQWGAEVPFVRPPELATDEARTQDVVLHALRELPGHEYVVVLQPTSPLRIAEDIDGAVDLLLERRAAAVLGVCETDHPPQWNMTLPPDRSLAEFLRDTNGKRSQELPISYRLNGAVYVYECRRLLSGAGTPEDDSYAYVMPRERSIDVDTALDLAIADFLLGRRSEGR